MRYLIIFSLILFSCSNNSKDISEKPNDYIVKEGDRIDGESLYKNNCANCHKCSNDFTGPAFQGCLKRWNNDKKAMYAFIRNPATSNTSYSKQMKLKWKASGIMTAFPQFTDKELDAIMSYCDFSHPSKK